MRNYVKEMEAITRKKKSLCSGFLLGISFFVAYSITILTDHTFLSIFCLILSMAFTLPASSLATYTEEESGIITDLESARELIEIIEGESEKFNDRKANALVSFFHSRKNEMGWREVADILEDYDYDEDSLWNDVEKKCERKRLWEKQ